MSSRGSSHGSVSTAADFGEERGPGPAAREGTGIPPNGFRLPGSTRLGPVVLQISDLERSLEYYREVLGLQLLGQDGRTASLGTLGGEPLVELRERRGIRPRPATSRTGLFHFALLLPDRASLGRFARHLQREGIAAGAADHLVSEALYLRDPDHLGIEVYADRPRGAWQQVGSELVMVTDPLDMASVLAAAGDEPWRGMPTGSVMGHVHLSVGDLALASEFYSEGLGFDLRVWSYPGALFLAAGGYHHHLGTNVWAGRDARPPAEDEAQLLEWTLELPAAEDMKAVAKSLAETGRSFDRVGTDRSDSILARDPWGTAVRVTGGR
ncbi:MAG: VOC family protein [Acidobacteria bacterium]|nr:VOC family protein [Acidobacteriota bacterium]